MTKPDVGRGESHTFPQFLPDGNHFVYFVESNDPNVIWGAEHDHMHQ